MNQPAQDTLRVYEVSPRDGLQNEPELVNTDDKLALIAALIAAGVRDIEVTSFVRPGRVPQLSDAVALSERLLSSAHGEQGAPRFWALVPNQRGLDHALDAGFDHVATFLSASQTHNRKNVNRTRAESLSALREVIATAKAEHLQVRSYISTAFGCPFEGAVDPALVVDLALTLRDSGADSVSLGDTTGMADPRAVQSMVRRLVDAGVPLDRLALHLHDTRGTALANTLAGFDAGVRTFDASIAGVGGCPYAAGAAGNAATEDMVYMFQAMGVSTGIDLDRLADAGLLLSQVLGRPLPGRYHRLHAGTLRSVSARRFA